jgi:tetratricopeptide (TPR) repeat protein
MSADLRIDFVALWSGWLAFAGVFASLAVLLGAAVYWLRSSGRGKVGQLSAVLLFAAIPFFVELSVVRVQEPFVLYRSYLWMPAYALLLCFALVCVDTWLSRRGVLPRRVFWGALLLAGAALFPLAQDRLRSFSSEENLWQDALLKLPSPEVPGADRIYYNLAGEAYRRKDFAGALRFSERVIAQNPRVFQGYLARGTSLLALGEFDAALRAFDEVKAHQPPPEFLGYIEFKRCGVFAARGEHDATIACLKRSLGMGYEMARIHLKMAGVEE